MAATGDNDNEGSDGPGGAGFRPDDLRRLARLVEENGLSELRYEEGDLRVTLRTAAFYRPAAVASAGPSAAGAGPFLPGAVFDTAPAFSPAAEADAGGDEDEAEETLVPVAAPLMGVFYRAPAPGEPPFVEIGDRVEAGQVIGMIEAMKVFNEIPAETGGVVRQIPAKNGALVQPGDPLYLLEP